MAAGEQARSAGERRAEVQSVQRALAILRSFTRERPEIGVSELAREHGLHTSSISRLIATLASAGFVRVNPVTGRYRLGFAPIELAGLVLLQLDIRAVAQPIMRELAQLSEETANLAVLDGHEMVTVEQAPSPKPCRYVSWVGRRVPLHASAHGKILLAFSPAAERGQLLAAIADANGNLPRLTPATLGTRAALAAELAVVAAQGYATVFGDLDRELAAVAAPVFDHSGDVVASLNLSGPYFRYTVDRVPRLAELAMEGARRISAELGYGSALPARPVRLPTSEDTTLPSATREAPTNVTIEHPLHPS